MSEFIVREIYSDNLKSELELVGFDKSYLHKGVEKYSYKNIKIFKLSLPQINILKQTALSVGADCATHREVITAKAEITDCLLGGSVSQLKKIAQKLKSQPFRLQKLAETIEEKLDYKILPWNIKGKKFDFERPYLIGVVNLTSDSFSDGGDYFEFEAAKKRVLELVEDGADVIELGAESTKPFSSPVSAEAQLEKLIPILEFIKENNIEIPISIDTRSSEVARVCLENGASIINDVSGTEFDSKIVDVVANNNAYIVIQHTKGTPENMQENPTYENLMDEIVLDLMNKVDFALSKGVKRANIIVDPGIGFGKTNEHNFEILKRVKELKSLECPVMVGISRKSLLKIPKASNEEKDIYTLALNAILMDKQVNFIRVHNIKLHKQLLNILFS